jgi:mannosyl-3-phosphoglycerate phosphatase
MSGADRFLVFTDLDGSLLDHHSYSYQDALPHLRLLERAAIPVIPASSKTRSEIEQLRADLGNDHPFIAENGAAVFIPVGYFSRQPDDTVERNGFWVREMSPPRQRWLDLLGELDKAFVEEYDYFYRAGVEGIARMTGLSLEKAAGANSREYSEPVKWFGTEARRVEFIDRLQAAGATVLQGGRFLSVAGDTDKGRALVWLREVFRSSDASACWHDLAVGDSANDCAMLEVSEMALLVRSSVHDFPPLQRNHGVLFSTELGPAGWAEGVTRWLHSYNINR